MKPDSQKPRPAAKPGFTLLELIVVIFLVIFLIGLLLPAISETRGPHPRIQCQTRMKNLALAANLYEGKTKRFPPSCYVPKYGPTESKDGYSFLVALLPNLEQEAIWKRMDVNVSLDKGNDGKEFDGRNGKQINRPDECLAISLPVFRCPSSKIDYSEAITNYKAVSASTRTAYEVSSRADVGKDGLDIYGVGKKHTASDGVMYVGSRTTVAAISDGVSSTLMLTETEEPVYSRWIVGQECGLYTMTDDTAFLAPTDDIPYIRPAGFTPEKYGSASTIPKEKRKTNLNRDYKKNPYPWGEAGFRSERYSGEGKAGKAKFGPSSAHQGNVIIHATADGMIMTISKDIDPAAYFFWTTRNGGEPTVDLYNIP